MLRIGITARRYLRDGPRLPEIRVSVLSFLLHTHDVGWAEVFVERTGPRLGLRLVSLVLARLRTHPGRGMQGVLGGRHQFGVPKITSRSW